MENQIDLKNIEDQIFKFRGIQVMLDRDLAMLYGVQTKRLIEQVKRNIKRFPEHFMFQLNDDEMALLRTQIATLKKENGNRGKHSKYNSFVFSEHGVAMLSTVIK